MHWFSTLSVSLFSDVTVAEIFTNMRFYNILITISPYACTFILYGTPLYKKKSPLVEVILWDLNTTLHPVSVITLLYL